MVKFILVTFSHPSSTSTSATYRSSTKNRICEEILRKQFAPLCCSLSCDVWDHGEGYDVPRHPLCITRDGLHREYWASSSDHPAWVSPLVCVNNWEGKHHRITLGALFGHLEQYCRNIPMSVSWMGKQSSSPWMNKKTQCGLSSELSNVNDLVVSSFRPTLDPRNSTRL